MHLAVLTPETIVFQSTPDFLATSLLINYGPKHWGPLVASSQRQGEDQHAGSIVFFK